MPAFDKAHYNFRILKWCTNDTRWGQGWKSHELPRATLTGVNNVMLVCHYVEMKSTIGDNSFSVVNHVKEEIRLGSFQVRVRSSLVEEQY